MIDLRAAISATAIGGTQIGDDAIALLEAAMAACDPVAWVARNLARAGDGLRIGERVLVPDDGGVLRILGIGKAAPAIVAAVLDAIGEHEALAIGKRGTPAPRGVTTLFGAHPLPDEDSVLAGRAALDFAARTTARDRLLAIVGGGASALACAPTTSLAELRDRTDALARAGVPIAELNAERGRLDALKHGGLAAAAKGPVLALVLDDIPGGGPRIVGSGPCDLPHVPHVVIADNDAAVEAALAVAATRGLVAIRGELLRGEARELGSAIARDALARARPCAVVLGGEPTVTRRGDGKGGRTMELALSAARTLAGHERIALIAFATDGDDGSSGAAGAVVDGTTALRAIDLDAAFAESDTATLLARIGDLVVTGPTGTNVCDLVVVVAR